MRTTYMGGNPLKTLAAFSVLAALFLAGGAPPVAAGETPAVAAANGASQEGAANNSARLVRDGLVIDFSVKPVIPGSSERKELLEGDLAEIAFRITDAATGKGVPALYPAAWVDLAKTTKGEMLQQSNCKDRAALYLQGIVGMRPMLDMNSYFVMVMNNDSTIAVIDPIVGVTGITKLYTQILLPRPGEDWAKTRNEKRMYVTMPRADRVAVIDTETFKVAKLIDVGKRPMRIVMQPDEKYLWVGNNSRKEQESGVTVIDVETLKVAAHIGTGIGHHEIAFSEGSRYAFVTNRRNGTVSVIDIATLRKLKDIQTGSEPLSIAYSQLSKMIYVSDGQEGVVSVIDPERLEVKSRVALRPGIGPVRATPDGRWIMAVNTSKNLLHVVDAATNRLVHDIPVGEKPFSVSFSRAFAYVRSLGTERVSMFELVRVGGKRLPPVITFGAGAKAPGKSVNLSLAEPIVEAAGEAAVLVASPADQTVYYYMEGMNAPMGNFRNYGHRPRAVQVVSRALQEGETGHYAAKAKIPAAGEFSVAFLLDSPRVLHCFTFNAKVNPSLKHETGPIKVEYLTKERVVEAGKEMRLRFRLSDTEAGKPHEGLKDVRVRYYRAPGLDRTEVPATSLGKGVYEAKMPIPHAGAYYVYIAAPSARTHFADLPYITFRAVSDKKRAQRKRAPNKRDG